MEFMEIKAKTVDDAITEALIKLETTSDQIEYEVIEKGSTGFFGFASKPAIIKVRKVITNDNRAKEFLDNIFKVMNMNVDVVIEEDEEKGSVDIDLRGDDMGPLIGKRGQTLDALQYLTSLVVNKDSASYKRVKVDTENYRKRRKDTLENLAKNIAYKVKRTKRSVSLEPMNPYERRVIHSALQNDKYVSTHSEGEDPYRHVVVTIKR